MVVVVVVVFLHAGEFPDARPDGAVEGLPPAAFRPLRRNVCVHGRESVHAFIDVVVPEHHFASCIIPIVDGVNQWCALWMFHKPSLLSLQS